MSSVKCANCGCTTSGRNLTHCSGCDAAFAFDPVAFDECHRFDVSLGVLLARLHGHVGLTREELDGVVQSSVRCADTLRDALASKPDPFSKFGHEVRK